MSGKPTMDGWMSETYHGWVVSKLAANMKDRESERVAFVM